MPLFSIKNEQLERVKEVPFRSERKDIQRITETSLKEVFGFEFVRSELELGNLRITTSEEIRQLGKAGWTKYDEMNGMHFYRKPKKFGK
jgi:hypothetical protein